ncbi:MAG: SusD/RagB family nutrient-binding outer membrane lipoprotein [Bacteroidetes bacterium]|nr:SusD/RagB family nutrient-binding outer membrane lipoprotein [Bacteroidota bacterium]
MRKIFNRTIKLKVAAGMTMLVFLISISCTKDFDELNQNPFQPTQTEIGPLFNSVVQSLQLGWNEQFYVHNEVLYKQSQLGALTSEAWSNLSIGTEEIWANYYQALAHIRDIEKRIEDLEKEQSPESLNNLKGMVKIITAYKTFRVTDLFGDMPFFNAGRGFESLDYVRPEFDTQEEIYKYLLNDLKWAAENMDYVSDSINGEVYYDISQFDNLLYGDLEMWVKFANSLRLRHAMRMVEVEPDLAAEIIGDIIGNELPVIEGYNFDSPILESVCMWPRQQAWLRQSASWSFREHKNLRMGSVVWHQISSHDSLDGSGIFDPRAFIFFESNNEGDWVPYPQIPEPNTPPAGGIPYGNHRDLNYTIKGEDCIYSPFNYYLTRDEYDVPEVLITGAEVHYLKAEAFMRGIGVGVDEQQADLEYFQGARASVSFWKNVMNGSEIWINIDPGINNTNDFTIPNLIYMTEDKLSLLYAQRWLDAFRQPWEAYALARRTKATPREGDPIDHFRLPYPPSEIENNPVNTSTAISRQGGDEPMVKLWWIP